MMDRETRKATGGWKPLPLPLKIFFVFLCLSVVLAFPTMTDKWYFLFGFIFGGYAAKALALLFHILAPLILLMAMWKKVPWTWKYALVYLMFFTLNGLFGTIAFMWVVPQGLFIYLWPALIFGVALAVLTAVFACLFWRSRAYFQKQI